MKAHSTAIHAGVVALLLATAGCKQHGDANQQKTHFPGMVTADGRTSGEVMAANGSGKTNGTYAGGTPGIAGGAGGNTSGAGTGGSTQESGQGPTQGVSAPRKFPMCRLPEGCIPEKTRVFMVGDGSNSLS